VRLRVVAYVTRERNGRRELNEEAGLDPVQIERELAAWNTRYENHAFEIHTEGPEPADAWEHVVHGDGDDAGLVFRYRSEPVKPDLLLWGRVDPILELL